MTNVTETGKTGISLFAKLMISPYTCHMTIEVTFETDQSPTPFARYSAVCATTRELEKLCLNALLHTHIESL